MKLWFKKTHFSLIKLGSNHADGLSITVDTEYQKMAKGILMNVIEKRVERPLEKSFPMKIMYIIFYCYMTFTNNNCLSSIISSNSLNMYI